MNRLRGRLTRLLRKPRPANPHRDDGLTALLDAVMAEQQRGPCGCLTCQIDFDHDGDPT